MKRLNQTLLWLRFELAMSQEIAQATLNQRRLGAWMIDAMIVLGSVILLSGLGWLVGLTYWVLRDGLFDGQSIGKRFMGLQVIACRNRKPCSFIDSLARNVLWVVPVMNVATGITALYALIHDREGRHWGDRLAQTQVYSTRS